MKDIEDRVGEVIMAGFPMPDAITRIMPTHNLTDDLALDSLDIVSLATKVEDEFNIRLSDDVIDVWRTVADVARSVKAQLP